MADNLINKLFKLIFEHAHPLDDEIDLGSKLTALKRLIEPTHSKFGFALSDDSTASSTENLPAKASDEPAATMSTDSFTRQIRK